MCPIDGEDMRLWTGLLDGMVGGPYVLLDDHEPGLH